jgi:basic membrane protein A
MTPTTNRWRAIALVAAIAVTAAACGGDSSTDTTDSAAADTTTAAPAADAPSFIYITPDPLGVNEFLLLGEAGTQSAAARLGGTAKTFESTDSGSMRSNIEAALEEDPSVIVLTTFDMIQLADEFSTANPDQGFILIDACADEPAPNLHCAFFREHEGSYLLGIEAAMLTESNKIGTVAALDIPFIHRWSDAFAAGAMSVATIEDTQLFVGGDNPFSDPARAKEQALAMAAQGIDHIQAAASAGNFGVFEAAEEEGIFAYGVDVNQCGDAPGRVIDNNLKRVDVVTDLLIGQVLDGTAEVFNEFGLAEGGIGVVALTDDVASSGCVIADHPDVIEAVAAAAAEIIAGTIVVEDPMFAATEG